MNEPSVVAVNVKDGRPVAVGAEAKRMILWLISEGALLLTVPEEDQTPSPEMNMMGHSVAHHPIAPASHHAEMEMEQDDDDFDNEAEDNEGEQQP